MGVRESSSTAFPESIAGNWIWSKGSWAWTGTMIWDAGIANGGLPHCAIMLLRIEHLLYKLWVRKTCGKEKFEDFSLRKYFCASLVAPSCICEWMLSMSNLQDTADLLGVCDMAIGMIFSTPAACIRVFELQLISWFQLPSRRHPGWPSMMAYVIWSLLPMCEICIWCKPGPSPATVGIWRVKPWTEDCLSFLK